MRLHKIHEEELLEGQQELLSLSFLLPRLFHSCYSYHLIKIHKKVRPHLPKTQNFQSLNLKLMKTWNEKFPKITFTSLTHKFPTENILILDKFTLESTHISPQNEEQRGAPSLKCVPWWKIDWNRKKNDCVKIFPK